MKLHNMPNILVASNIDNFSRYDGTSFGISASASYSSANSPTDEQHSSNKSSGWSVGAVISTQGVGAVASANVGKGKSDGTSETYTNSHVGSLAGTTTITAGDTTNIIGGQVLGDSVTLNTTNLNIQSLQDTATYDSKQKDASGSITVGAGFSASGSFSRSNIDADYASVNEQSGILAGDGGYNINVTNDTSLIGGIITSTGSAEDNKLNSFSTGTLIASNIDNFSRYDGTSFGISGGVSYSYPNPETQTSATTTIKTPPAGQEEGQWGVSKSIGYGSDGESQTSTTYSGINTDNITISGIAVTPAEAGVQNNGIKTITMDNISDIHTDTTTDTVQANSGSLTNTFDADAVQHKLDVQVSVSEEFNTVAPSLIADYAILQAENLRNSGNEEEAVMWDEGGAYRVALQALAGGLSVDISGALGAGVTATAIPIVTEIINNSDLPDELKPLMIEAAGTLIGAAAGSLGGDATAGAISGFSDVENNYLTHWEKEQRLAQINACAQDPVCLKAVVNYWNRVDQEQSFAGVFWDDVEQGFFGLYDALNKLNSMDTSSLPLVAQGGLDYLMINKERVLGENESFFNVIGTMEDIQGYIEDYNNAKTLIDQNKSR